MNVSIALKETGQPLHHEGVLNTYQKGDLYCVYMATGDVYKYPLANVWRIREDYGEHQTKAGQG